MGSAKNEFHHGCHWLGKVVTVGAVCVGGGGGVCGSSSGRGGDGGDGSSSERSGDGGNGGDGRSTDGGGNDGNVIMVVVVKVEY